MPRGGKIAEPRYVRSGPYTQRTPYAKISWGMCPEPNLASLRINTAWVRRSGSYPDGAPASGPLGDSLCPPLDTCTVDVKYAPGRRDLKLARSDFDWAKPSCQLQG